VPDVLGPRDLNRALLARQFLLAPLEPRGVIETVEHLIGLQAQAPFPPYYGLWSRIAGFRPADLAELIENRAVVRIALMRGTIHLVSARDCLPLRRLTQPMLERVFRTNHGKRLPGVDLTAVTAAGRELVESEPMTFSQLGDALAKHWPDYPPADLAQAVRTHVPLVQVPPRAVWGRSGQSLHTSAESWLGHPEPRPGHPEPRPGHPEPRPGHPEPRTEQDLAWLVIRYLAAFGPATVRDMQAWSGLTGLRAAVEALRPALVTFRTESGTELFDLPDAPRPPADTPAPVRLIAEFDNLVLSHADRTRIISEDHRARLYTVNGIFPGTVLIDGFVAGKWRLATARDSASLTIELWKPVSNPGRRALEAEAARLLDFAAPGSTRDLRFAPVPAP
jgi:hypothetical protein